MLGGFLETLLNLIYPKICLACRRKLKDIPSVDNLVCLKCWLAIQRNIPPFCSCCGRHMEQPVKNICSSCMKKPLHFNRAFSPCVYAGTIKELIHAFKYKNKDHLGFTLSRLMIEFIKEYNLNLNFLDFIVPMPLHKVRLREREFNQAEVLGKYIAAEFKKPLLVDSLKRIRNSRTQTELETEERFLNVKGIFSIDKKEVVRGKNILLVDDVLTSGATSSEAASALKQAGANLVFVLTLAN